MAILGDGEKGSDHRTGEAAGACDFGHQRIAIGNRHRSSGKADAVDTAGFDGNDAIRYGQ